GERVLEEFEAFAGDLDLLEEQSRDLPAWPLQPRNVPQGNRIIIHGDHDKGDCAAGLSGRLQGDLRPTGDQHVNIALDDLGGEDGEPLDVALRVAELDHKVLTLHVAEGPQSLLEGGEGRPGAGVRVEGAEDQIADPGAFARRLGLDGKRRTEETQR